MLGKAPEIAGQVSNPSAAGGLAEGLRGWLILLQRQKALTKGNAGLHLLRIDADQGSNQLVRNTVPVHLRGALRQSMLALLYAAAHFATSRAACVAGPTAPGSA